MVSYTAYKVIHLAGIFMVLLSLGGVLVVHSISRSNDRRWRTLASATNGLGLLLTFVAGFGLIARLEFDWPWPLWVYLKVLIWLGFGFLMALAGRLPQLATVLWWGALVLAVVAAGLANFKPI